MEKCCEVNSGQEVNPTIPFNGDKTGLTLLRDTRRIDNHQYIANTNILSAGTMAACFRLLGNNLSGASLTTYVMNALLRMVLDPSPWPFKGSSSFWSVSLIEMFDRSRQTKRRKLMDLPTNKIFCASSSLMNDGIIAGLSLYLSYHSLSALTARSTATKNCAWTKSAMKHKVLASTSTARKHCSNLQRFSTSNLTSWKGSCSSPS